MDQQAASARPATRVLMLVDEPIEFDRRVRLFSERYRARGAQVDVLNVLRDRAGKPSLFQTLAAVWRTLGFIVLSVAPHVSGMRKRIHDLLAHTSSGAYERLPLFRFAGLSLAETAGMYFRGARMRDYLQDYGVLHANDLRCALYAAGASNEAPVVYDSHEFNPFRNRKKMSWFRIVTNCAFEAAAVRRAGRIVTVSLPIADAFHDLYSDGRAVVLENRFYDEATVEPVPLASRSTKSINLVYFGSLNEGRALSLLNQLGGHRDISALAFVYGSDTDRARGIRRELDNVAVAEQNDPHSLAFPIELLNRPTLSWCVLEDVSLSYTFALPNKFFQSLTLGIPIVASRGSYLGDLVSEHGVGLEIDPTTPVAEIAARLEAVSADRYRAMQAATRRLAQAYAALPIEKAADRCIAGVLGRHLRNAAR